MPSEFTDPRSDRVGAATHGKIEGEAGGPKPAAAAMPDLKSLGISEADTGAFLAYIVNKHFARDAASFVEDKAGDGSKSS